MQQMNRPEVSAVATAQSTKKPRKSSSTVIAALKHTTKDVPAEDAVEYTPADLRPGYLVLPEFSRPGGIKYVRDENSAPGSRREKRVVTDNPFLEKTTTKIVNAAYAALLNRFAYTPFGFFCEPHERDEADSLLKDVRSSANFVNKLAKEQKSNRRVEIAIFPIRWDETDMRFRNRIGRLIGSRLIELRDVYTSKDMNAYRWRMERVRSMDRLVVGEQSEYVMNAIKSTEQQRKVMVAIYGDKCPINWVDPQTNNIYAHIRLDFEPIDRAIKMFVPGYNPPPENR